MKIIQFSVLQGAVTSPADLGGWIFTTLPPHSLPAVIVINELHYESTDTCLRLPFSSHIPHLFGLNYAVQSSFFFFLNNLPACCSVSPGRRCIRFNFRPTSGKFRAVMQTLPGCTRLNDCWTWCTQASASVCGCLCESWCQCVCIYDYVCLCPKASALPPVPRSHPHQFH